MGADSKIELACQGARAIYAGGGRLECQFCGALVRADLANDPTYGFAAGCDYIAPHESGDTGAFNPIGASLDGREWREVPR